MVIPHIVLLGQKHYKTEKFPDYSDLWFSRVSTATQSAGRSALEGPSRGIVHSKKMKLLAWAPPMYCCISSAGRWGTLCGKTDFSLSLHLNNTFQSEGRIRELIRRSNDIVLHSFQPCSGTPEMFLVEGWFCSLVCPQISCLPSFSHSPHSNYQPPKLPPNGHVFSPFSRGPEQHLGKPERQKRGSFLFLRYPEICFNPISKTPVDGSPTKVQKPHQKENKHTHTPKSCNFILRFQHVQVLTFVSSTPETAFEGVPLVWHA